MFIAISGLSGSGKNTVIKRLSQMRPNLKVLTHSTCTTRPPRESDGEFQTYVYMTEEDFRKGIEENHFIEHEIVHGYYYGTLKSAFEKVIEDSENDYIKDIDVKGAINLKKYLEKKTKMKTIFLDAPDKILEERLRLRGESEERIKTRLSRGELERQYKNNYDLVIENIDLELTLNAINEFLNMQDRN